MSDVNYCCYVVVFLICLNLWEVCQAGALISIWRFLCYRYVKLTLFSLQALSESPKLADDAKIAPDRMICKAFKRNLQHKVNNNCYCVSWLVLGMNVEFLLFPHRIKLQTVSSRDILGL